MTIETWDEQYKIGAGLRYWPDESALGFIARRVQPSARVLDVGCGVGNNLLPLALSGITAYGIDTSQPALDLAAAHLWKFEAMSGFVAPRLMQHDVRRMPLLWSGTFDAVLDVRTLQHFQAPAEREIAYAEVRRVLKPGGWLGSGHLSHHTRPYAKIFPTSPAAWLPSAVEFRDALIDAGFVVSRFIALIRSYPGRNPDLSAVEWAGYWVVDAEKT